VTVSASYGAGGSVVGPGAARALGLSFLDRAVPTRLTGGDRPVPVGEEAMVEERTSSLMERIVSTFANLPDAFGPGAPPPARPTMSSDDELRQETADRVCSFVEEHGGGVVLGWGATVLLPDAFHVRLYGPPERRVERAMEIEGVDREEAERRQAHTDRVRSLYLKRLYGRDVNDLRLYHLALDTTAMDLEEATALVSRGATAFWMHRPATPLHG
jgi:hypothetical protein